MKKFKQTKQKLRELTIKRIDQDRDGEVRVNSLGGDRKR